MSAPEDLEPLVRRASAGDRAAFENAIDGCGDRLRRFVEARFGPHLREVVDVEDVLQETYVQALESISGFVWTGRDSFLRWLNAIAEHVILALARRRRVRRSRVLFLDQDTWGLGASSEPTPSKMLRRGERLCRLEAALDGLSSDYREAIQLVRIEGLPIKEAARRMGRTPKAVAHLLARALTKLRESFSDTESLNLPPVRLDRREGDDDA